MRHTFVFDDEIAVRRIEVSINLASRVRIEVIPHACDDCVRLISVRYRIIGKIAI